MDGSFLSDASVVSASRSFVCIRLATYEDEQEAAFMKSLYLGRSGQLENTTFAILSPDGKRKLTAAGRGPMHAYRGSSSLAAGMQRIARQHTRANAAALSDSQLPMMKNLDLALNVAAADGLPLIVTVADDKEQHGQLSAKLIPLAWSEAFAGQFIYAAVFDGTELKPVTGAKGSGNLVVDPGPFGLSGKVLARFGADASREKMTAALQHVVANFPRTDKDHSSHVRLGLQLGIDWESVIPETDPMSLRAKERVRGHR